MDETITNTIAVLSLLQLLMLLRSKVNKCGNRKIIRRRSLWSRKWLMRRDAGRGAANFVFYELKLEDPRSFKNFTRMSTTTFDELLLKVGGHLERQNTILRQCIPAQSRLLVTLRFLATGETYQSLSYSFRISVPALSLLIMETVKVISNALKDAFLRTPRRERDWKIIALKFRELWNFPMCLGALDGKHIAFRAKKSDGSFYYNYKGFHSIVLLALVDAEYNFIYIDVGCNGRVSDGGVYNSSNLSTAVEQNLLHFPADAILPNTNMRVPYVIVADEAFKFTKRIIKPWGQRVGKEKKIFNYRLSRARRVVENAFGILANKFQILQKDINLTVEKVQDITITCCVLHNFIKQKEGKKYLQGIDFENINTMTMIEGEWRRNVFLTKLEKNRTNRTCDTALAVREQFTTYFNGTGAVSWQDEAIRKFNF